ncbi:MAG TPA: AarF/ABC1/UbiB kinase family protein [Steroidobacteraceae bacterium]|nr:AarF/ABC1/UbiB kinase family protein [Steroidobacteraceae bacterium]
MQRMLRFGLLGSELAASAALAAVRQVSAGHRPNLATSFLTPGNAARLARRLAAMRGPAMKLGQILSLQGEDIVPEEFRAALAVLRSQGYAMPDTQLRRVLGREYGKGWERRFDRFDYEPVAAASIGQVHRARKRGGTELALKIQFPGVARSVDSDVDNVAGLLRRFEFLPVKLDITALAAEAKRQLRLETDYEAEARSLERYRRLVADTPGVVVPRVDRGLTTQRILAMEWIEGEPLEALASEAVTPARRNAAARVLFELIFREFFEFRFMQTDPNIANYRYLPATQQIALLDLGSVLEFEPALVAAYRRAVRGVIDADRDAIRAAAVEIGYVRPQDPPSMVDRAVDIIELVCEPLAHRGAYDFAASGLIGRARKLGLEVMMGEGLRSPPPQTLFLHRKLLGNFLIAVKLRAHINIHAIVTRFL